MPSIEEVLLKVKVDFDKKEISAGTAELKKLDDQVKKSDSNFKGWAAGISKGALIAGAAIAALGYKFVQALREGFGEVAQTEAALERAGAAAARAGVNVDLLKEAAEGLQTPLVGGAEKLQIISDLVSKGFNPKQAQEMAKAFIDIGVAARGAGETGQDAILKVVDALNTGRIMGPELLRVFPQLKSLGADALKAIASGSANAEIRQKAFNAVLADSGVHAGAAERYLKTFNGQMEAVAISADDAKEALAKGFLEGLQPLIQGLSDASGQAVTFQGIAEKVGYVVGTVLTKGFQAGGAAIAGFSTLFSTLSFVGASVTKSIVDSLNTLILKFADVFKALGDITPFASEAYAKLREASTSLQGASINLGKSVQTTQKNMEQAAEKAEKWTQQLFAGGEASKEAAAGMADLGKQTGVAGQRTEELTASQKKAIEEAKKLKEAQDKAFEESIKKSKSLFENMELLRSKTSAVTLATKEWAESLGLIDSGTINGIAQAFTDLLKPAETGVQKLIGSMEPLKVNLDEVSFKAEDTRNAFLKFADTLSLTAGIIGELAAIIGGKLGKALDGIARGVEGGAQAFAGFGQIMSGDILGGIQNMIGGIGKLVSAFQDLFGHDWESDSRNIVEAIYNITGLSADFMQQLAEDAERYGDATIAFLLNLKGVIDDLGGINAENIQQIFTAAHDLFSVFERGQITADQLAASLGSIWSELAAAAEKFGGVYAQQLKEMIRLTREMGIEVPEITAFMAEKLKALIGDINTWAGDMGNIIDEFMRRAVNRAEKAGVELGDLSEKMRDDLLQTFLTEEELNQIGAKFEKLGMFIAAAVGAALEQGQTWREIIAQLGPSIDTLLETAERFGLRGSAAFQQFLAILERFRDNQKELARLDFTGNILKNLELLGGLTKKMVNDFAGQVRRMFQELAGDAKKGTVEYNAALQSMAPYLSQLIAYYASLGIKVPKHIQDLYDQAVALGFVTGQEGPDTAAWDKFAEVIETLTQGIYDLIDAMNGVPSEVTTDIFVTTHEHTIFSEEGDKGGKTSGGTLKNPGASAPFSSRGGTIGGANRPGRSGDLIINLYGPDEFDFMALVGRLRARGDL